MLASGTIITPCNRDLWLADRSLSIGASEAAAAVGEDERKSPLELYCLKRGLKRADKPSIAMRRGLYLEPLVEELYQEDSGREIESKQLFLRDASRPHVTATLDGLLDDRVVELKTTTWRNKELDLETDEIPNRWYIQIHIQMHLADRGMGEIGVLVDDTEFKRIPVERNQELIDLILPRMDEFWAYVQGGIEPPLSDGHRDDVDLYRYVPQHPDAVTLGLEDLATVQAYQEIGTAIGKLEKERKELKRLLLAGIGTHSAGRLPDGRHVVRKVVERKGYVVEAGSYEQLCVEKVRAD